MSQNFKDYFHFSKIERQGIFWVLLILFGLIGLNFYISSTHPSFNEETENIDSLLAQLFIEQKSVQAEQIVNSAKLEAEENEITVSLFFFDPNGLPISKWVALGLSNKQAETIKRYEAKGGSFRSKQDVLKMYVIDSAFFDRLEPFIQLPDNPVQEEKIKVDTEGERPKENDWTKKAFPKVTLDINLADSTDFLKLYGIGPFYSGRIVAYREALGGYHNKHQLTEIWKFSDSLLSSLDSSLLLGEFSLKQYNVNEVEAKELKEHPYISWNVANSIVKIRKTHGKYQALEELKKSVLINDSLLRKIRPYLKLED